MTKDEMQDHPGSVYAWELASNKRVAREYGEMPRNLKRIIKGVTYNTATSIGIEIYSSPNHHEELYQTKSGSLFLVAFLKSNLKKERADRYALVPVTKDEAVRWVEFYDKEASLEIAQIVETNEDEMDTTNSTVLRFPPALMRQVTASAKSAGMSRNEWIMRSLERSLADELKGD